MSTPPTGAPIRVIGTWLKGDGSPEVGSVAVRPLFTAASTGPKPRIVTMSIVTTTLDPNGSIDIDLVPSDDPGWMLNKQIPYKVWLNLSGSRESFYVYIVPPAPVDIGMIDHYSRSSIDVPKPLPASVVLSRRRG